MREIQFSLDAKSDIPFSGFPAVYTFVIGELESELENPNSSNESSDNYWWVKPGCV